MKGSIRLRRLRALSLAALALLGCGNSESSRRPPLGKPSDARVTQVLATASTSVAAISTTATTTSAQVPSTPGKRGMHEPSAEYRQRYAWLEAGIKIRTLEESFEPPAGYSRKALPAESFSSFLRQLPLRAEGSPVNTYERKLLLEGGDPRIAAVAELDLSYADIQQCADSVIRLHAEWRWSQNTAESVGYHFLSGDYAKWSRYREGQRPKVDGAKVVWVGGLALKNDHASYRKYLDMVFNYASTISLAGKSSQAVERSDVRAGDFFILPGGPGHVILILDLAENPEGKRMALLGQGYMPAQDFQVLRGESGGWFDLQGDSVDTPFWPVPFPWSSLHRMKEAAAP